MDEEMEIENDLLSDDVQMVQMAQMIQVPMDLEEDQRDQELEKDLPVREIKALNFSIYSSSALIRASVLNVNSEKDVESFRLGSTERSICLTCNSQKDCPGHLGKINLKMPIFHPFYTSIVSKILEVLCLRCNGLGSE